MLTKKIGTICIAGIYFLLLVGVKVCYSAEGSKPGQELDRFSLVQYKDNGEKKWLFVGKKADVEEGIVKIDEISVISCNGGSNFKLKAKTGYFNTSNKFAHLEDGVVIKNTSGLRLDTSDLDWHSEDDTITTKAKVVIRNLDSETVGEGAFYDLDKKIVRLDKNVSVFSRIQNLFIKCDGPFEINYNDNIATFYNNVSIKDPKGDVFADRVDVYFENEKKDIDKIIARQNVEIINRDSIIYAKEAVYMVKEGRLILPDKPKLVMKDE